MKSIYVNQVSDYIGKEITNQFVLQSIHLNTNSNGSIRYDCILSDNTGSINAVIWNEAINDDYMKYKSSIVSISGMVRLYDSKLSIQISNMKPTDSMNMDDFLFTMNDDVYESYVTSLNGILSEIENPNIKGLCTNVFTLKMCTTLRNMPATLNRYYSFNGGLLAFILNRVTMVKTILALYLSNPLYAEVKINKDVLIAAALLQDIGSMYSYVPFPIGKRTERGLLNNSITETISYVSKAIHCIKKTYELEESDINLLIHLISSNTTSSNKTIEGIILSNARNLVKDINAFHSEFERYDELHPMTTSNSIYSDYFNNYIMR